MSGTTRGRALRRTFPGLLAAVALLCSGCNYLFVSWADSRGTTSGTVNSVVLAGESRQINRKKPLFTVFPGDLCGSGPSDACIHAWITAANDYNRNSLATRTFVTRGNHDSSGLAEINAHETPSVPLVLRRATISHGHGTLALCLASMSEGRVVAARQSEGLDPMRAPQACAMLMARPRGPAGAAHDGNIRRRTRADRASSRRPVPPAHR